MGRLVWLVRANAEPAMRLVGAFTCIPMHPATFGRPVTAIFTCALGGDLEVLAEFLVAGFRAQREHVFAELVPVEVEGEGVEEQGLRDETVEGEHADLLEQVAEEHVIVGLEVLLEQTAEGGAGRLAVQDFHDRNEGASVLGRHASEVGGRVAHVLQPMTTDGGKEGIQTRSSRKLYQGDLVGCPPSG